MRDEAAAAALGLTSRQGSATGGAPGGGSRRREKAAATFKSLGGAFKGMAKDVASAGRSQLRSLAGGDRGQAPLVAAVAGISDGGRGVGACPGSLAPSACVPLDLHALTRALHGFGVAPRLAYAHPSSQETLQVTTPAGHGRSQATACIRASAGPTQFHRLTLANPAHLTPAGYEYSQATAGSESLVAVLHAIATARGQPAVLSPAELAAYAAALSRHRVADRMALAAELVGEEEEALFWRRLPATLAWLNAALAAARRRSAAGDARIGAGSGAPSRSSPDSGPPSEPPRRRSSSAPVGAAGPGAAASDWARGSTP